LRSVIDEHLDGALSTVGASTANHGGLPLIRLSFGCYRQCAGDQKVA
jgi:hypothetical protein